MTQERPLLFFFFLFFEKRKKGFHLFFVFRGLRKPSLKNGRISHLFERNVCLDLSSKKRSPRRAGAEKPLSGPGGNSGREKKKKTAVRGLPRGGGRTSAGRRPGKRPERAGRGARFDP